VTYELFKQSIGGDVADEDPMQKALWASASNRHAVGIVEDILVQVSLSYTVEEGDDSYELKVHLETGRYWENNYNNKFGADAVFEKLVNDYNLKEDPDEDDIEQMREAVELRREDMEEDKDGGIVSDLLGG
jgi:hypothetical protein